MGFAHGVGIYGELLCSSFSDSDLNTAVTTSPNCSQQIAMACAMTFTHGAREEGGNA